MKAEDRANILNCDTFWHRITEKCHRNQQLCEMKNYQQFCQSVEIEENQKKILGKSHEMEKGNCRFPPSESDHRFHVCLLVIHEDDLTTRVDVARRFSQHTSPSLTIVKLSKISVVACGDEVPLISTSWWEKKQDVINRREVKLVETRFRLTMMEQ